MTIEQCSGTDKRSNSNYKLRNLDLGKQEEMSTMRMYSMVYFLLWNSLKKMGWKNCETAICMSMNDEIWTYKYDF